MASPNTGQDSKSRRSRAVESVFYCYPAMVRDTWLDSLRGQAEFERILDSARTIAPKRSMRRPDCIPGGGRRIAARNGRLKLLRGNYMGLRGVIGFRRNGNAGGRHDA